MFLRESNRSTALKTLSLRIRGVKTELEDAGLETEGMAETTAQLQAKLLALTGGKVDIMLNADEFKSTTQILREMASVWEEMTDVQQAAALELLGGKRQANILSSLLTNFETVEDVIETSMNSAGSAIAENEKWLDSIEGKTYQFTNALQTLWSNMLNSEVIKGFLDFGTSAIQLLDTGAGKVIALVSAMQLMAKFKGFSIGGVFKGIEQSMQQLNKATNMLNMLKTADTIDGVFKPSNITAYANAVGQLTPKLQAQALAAKGLSAEQIRNALTLNGVDEANTRVAMSQLRLIQATQQAISVTGQEAATILASKNVKLSDAATSFLQANATKEVTEEMLKNAVAAGTLTSAEAAQIAVSIGLTGTNHGLAASFKAIGTSISFMFKSNPVGLILSIASALLSLLPIFDMIGDANQDIIDKANEAKDAIKSINDEFKSDAKTVTDYAERFAELAQGVDMLTGKNLSLTSDDYEEFLDLSNQLADIFPTLSRNYDENGNAIVQLSGDTNAMVGSLKELLDIQRQITSQQIADKLPDLYAGVKLKSDSFNKELDNLEAENNAYKDRLQILQTDVANTINTLFDTGKFEVSNDDQGRMLAQNVRSILNEVGISLNNFVKKDMWGNVTGYTYKLGILQSDEEIEEARSKISAEIDVLANEYTTKINGLSSEIETTINENKANWGSLSSAIAAWLSTDSTYKILDDNMQSMVQTVVNNLDYSSLDFESWDEAQEWIKDNIVESICDNKDGIQDAFNSLLEIDTNETSYEVYEGLKASLLTAIEGLPADAQNAIKKALGVGDDSGYETYFNHVQSILQDDYDDMVSGLTLSDLEIASKLDIPAGTLLTWDELKQKIEEVKRSLNSGVSVQTYSEISASIESYNEVLSQTSEIVSDNTEVTQEYKDSLTELGISQEDLADCFDENNNLIVKNAALLNKLVKQKKQDKQATVQQAKAYGQLQYKTTVNQIGQLVDRMADEVKASGYVSAATLDTVNALRQQLTAIKETIQQYALLELSLSDAAQAYSEFEAAKERDAKLTYGDSLVDALDVLNKGFKTGQVGSEAFQYAVKLIVPPDVYENIDNVQERMKAIHDYVDKNPVFADWFTIDEGEISITMDNIKAFIQDGLDGIDGRAPAFIGTLEDFDLSNSIQSIEDLATALGTTEAATLAMLTEFEKYDASWGDIVYRLTTTELDRNIDDATNALEEAITAQEQFIRDGKRLYDENGKYTQEYQEIVNGVTNAYNDLGVATQAAVDNATTFTQVETILKGITGELKLSQEQADNLARSLGLISEGQSITIENGAIVLTQEQIDVLNEKLTGLEKPTILDIQLASDEIDVKIQELKTELSDIEAGVSLNGRSADEVRAEIAELTATQQAIELVYSITPSTDQNDSNLEKLGEWETNGVNITVRADTTEFDTDMETVNEAEIPEKEVPITTTAEDANEEIDTVTNNNPPDKTVNVAMQGVSYALSQINSISDALDSLSGTSYHTVAIRYDNKTGGLGRADGNFHISGDAFASGTVGAPKTETSLVGELGPELIVDPSTGSWHTVGDHGAEFTQVKRGQIIFNHLQTKQLLENGHVTSRGRLQGGNFAFASGTAYGFGIYDDYVGDKDAFTNGSNNSANKAESSSIDDDVEQVVDFIEMKLEEIEAIIEKTSSRIANFLDDTTSIKSKDELYDELVKAEKDKSEAYLKAAEKYNIQAAEALSGVPQKYQEMARNGAIKIKDFIGEDQVEIAEKIQEYRDWAAKADEAENGHLEAIAAISEHRVEQLEDIATDFENIINIAKSHSDLLQAEMDLIEESGGRLSEDYYEELKKYSQKQLNDMQAERVALQKILDDSVAAGDVVIGSDDWYSMLETIYEVDKEIIDCKTILEEFQNAINELYWDNFDKFIAEIENVESELSNLYDLISDDDKIADEIGNWTDEGITALGLLAQQMENAQFKSQQYGKAIEKLRKDYAVGLYSVDEYNERLADLTNSQYDAIKSYEDAKDAIVDLNKTRVNVVKDGMQKEIDAYEELISKKKEALSEDKAAYDFQKSVQESNKNIKDIERKIAALAGNTSSSATAERKRLEAELLKAREELQDLYYDHSVEKQQEALDKELEDYTKNKQDQMDALDEYLKKEDQVIADSFGLVAENTKALTDTLIQISEEYGVTISDTVSSPWMNGANAIGTYEEQLDTTISATTKNLETLKQQLEDLQAQADKTADSIVKSTRYTVVTTNDGQQTSTKKYAKGSKSVEYDQWAIIDELGDELQLVPNSAGRLDYIKKGTGILNNTLTERLMDLAMDPTSMIENNRPVIGTPGIVTTNNNITIDNSVGTLLHVEHLDGSNPSEVSKLVDKAWEKKMQTLNNSIKKFTR